MESFLERFDRQKKKRYDAAKSILSNLTEVLRSDVDHEDFTIEGF